MGLLPPGLIFAFRGSGSSFKVLLIMAFLRRCILFLALSLAAMDLTASAKSKEERDFEAALGAFNDRGFPYAESKFSEFVQAYTNSPRIPEALLYQAQSRYQLSNYDGALKLLSTNQSQAGRLADQFLFWQAESLFGKKDFANAAQAYDDLVRQFPLSPRRLEAGINEALAYARLDQWPRVRDLLQQSDSVFQSALRANLISDHILRGYLLLSEAQLTTRDFSGAEASLQPMGKLILTPDIAWQRQLLLCRIAMADQRPEAALRFSTNLLAFASQTGRASLLGESIAFQGAVFERLGRLEEAILTYSNNLSNKVPPRYQREALLKLAALSCVQRRFAIAAQTLEDYVARYPDAEAADLSWLTAAQFRLQQCAPALGTNLLFQATTNTAPDSNCLQRAVFDLNTLSERFPQSTLNGKGKLALGVCYWLQGNVAQSQAAFQSAVQHLPQSFEQALAFFNLASAQMLQTNYAAAIANYKAVVEKYADYPEVTTNLFEGALYQTIRAGLALGQVDVCTNALAKILALYPNSFRTERAVLLAGQGMDPAGARELYISVAKASTNSSLSPEISLAIARTYEQENKWEDAIAVYDSWLDQFSNAPSRPEAEYFRGLSLAMAGRQTNALVCFTNFLARFPSTNQFAPLVRDWVASYYYTIGDYQKAETEYQMLALDWPGKDLAFQALLGAGRSAVARGNPTDAKEYFRNIYTNSTSSELQAQALYAYGDACRLMGDSAQTNKLPSYKDAIDAFDGVIRQFPTNRLAALALGAKADCLLQSRDYTNAIDAYQQIATNADPLVRDNAKCGIAVTLEIEAKSETGASQLKLLNQALNYYLDVFYDDELQQKGNSGLFWRKKSGEEAARLAETLKQWSQAISLYQHLEDLLPPLRDFYEAKKHKVEKNLPPVAE
jgi:TolA-binding protein